MSVSLAEYTHRYVPPSRPATGQTTLLLLHGTGGNENDLIPLGQALAPQAGFLSPRGRVLERGMPRFFRRIAEGVFDLQDLALRTEELAEFLQAAVAKYRFDPARVVAVGFSNGANIAASLLLTRPGLLRAAVLFRAMVPFEPAKPASLTGIPVWLGAGRNDSLVPAANIERLAALLREAGASVTLEWQPGGHGLAEGEVESAARWLDASGVLSGGA